MFHQLNYSGVTAHANVFSRLYTSSIVGGAEAHLKEFIQISASTESFTKLLSSCVAYQQCKLSEDG